MTRLKYDVAISSSEIANNTLLLNRDQLGKMLEVILLYPTSRACSPNGAQLKEYSGQRPTISYQMSRLELPGLQTKCWHDLFERGITIEGLDSSSLFAALGAQLLQALMGNHIQCQGQYGTFSFVNSTKKTVTVSGDPNVNQNKPAQRSSRRAS
jgi:hypothetical protein